MARHRLGIVLLVLIIAATVAAKLLLPADFFTVQNVIAHRQQLFALIQGHYWAAVFTFIGLYLATALFLPGALALTVAGGMVFGVIPAVVLVNLSASAGALMAFFASRHLMGHWVQERYRSQLAEFNAEMERHGWNYLLVLRILPIFPFLAVNYGAGLTKVPLRIFFWTTCIGVIPGSLIYAFIGNELRHVQQAREMLSWRILAALAAVALLSLAPVLRHHLGRRSAK